MKRTSNQLYVGSTVKITARTLPARHYVSNAVVYPEHGDGETPGRPSASSAPAAVMRPEKSLPLQTGGAPYPARR
ncbi:MAG: hypothetical protein ACLU9S_23555 [Oscillospiraceae bacterium]